MPIADTRMNRLAGVNRIIRTAFGGLPVLTLDDTVHADGVQARDKLDDVVRDLLDEGWNFNTDREVELAPDVTGKIAVPADALAVYFRQEHRSVRNVVARGDFMYDVLAETDVFTDTTLKFVVTRLLEFGDLPYAHQRYIVARAARELASETVANRQKTRGLEATERLALQKLEEAESESGGFSILDVSPSARMVARRRPPFA